MTGRGGQRKEAKRSKQGPIGFGGTGSLAGKQARSNHDLRDCVGMTTEKRDKAMADLWGKTFFLNSNSWISREINAIKCNRVPYNRPDDVVRKDNVRSNEGTSLEGPWGGFCTNSPPLFLTTLPTPVGYWLGFYRLVSVSASRSP